MKSESKNEIIIYQSPNGVTKIDVKMNDETVCYLKHKWLNFFNQQNKILVYILITYMKKENLKKSQLSRNT